jgi:predicted hydrocarbon binding protein
MIQENLTKEVARKYLSLRGEARGVTLKVDWEFILRHEGPEGLKRLEERLAELGYPLKYEEIKTMGFYPLGLDALSMAVINELFHYDKETFIEIGRAAPKMSIFLKIFLKHFISSEQAIKEAPEMWRRHYSVGDLKIEFNEEKRFAVIRLENFALHKIHCYNLLGYFAKILEMIINKEVSIVEDKCVFDGDSYHEFRLTWK